MNDRYQELISSFSGNHNVLLTSLLCTESTTTWAECKHLIVCPVPLLTLEMAVNRVRTGARKKNNIPTPEQIKEALNYASNKRVQYLANISNEPQVPHSIE